MRTIAAQIGPRALSSLTRAALASLRYVIVGPDAATGKGSKPDLRLVDERQLARVPSPADDRHYSDRPDDRRWPCALVSLSETGCLIQTFEPIGLEEGSRINLQFALPREGIVFARAECCRRSGAQVGLAFSDAESERLTRISRYVAGQLSA